MSFINPSHIYKINMTYFQIHKKVTLNLTWRINHSICNTFTWIMWVVVVSLSLRISPIRLFTAVCSWTYDSLFQRGCKVEIHLWRVNIDDCLLWCHKFRTRIESICHIFTLPDIHVTFEGSVVYISVKELRGNAARSYLNVECTPEHQPRFIQVNIPLTIKNDTLSSLVTFKSIIC